jgi:hypothetical protein
MTEQNSQDNGFVLDTPDQIAMWRLMSFRSMLQIEIKTGLRHSRGSVLKAAQQQGLTDKRTKIGAYKDIDALIVTAGGKSRPLD